MYKIPANTLFIGKKVVFVPECHSTNSLALELSQKEDLPEGTVVITDNQTAGRGQQGNVWTSEARKNLTFSLIIKPSFLAVKDQFLLNMAISLGVRDFIQEKLDDPVLVKWPNDIIASDLKLCGILIENQIQGNTFSNSVVGIGLNVNQKAFHAKSASSILMFTGKENNLSDALSEILTSLEKWYVLLRQYGFDRIKRAYLSSLYGMNEKRNFKTKNGRLEGMIKGVDDSGRLIISSGSANHYFNTKEVQFDFEPFK